MRCETACRGILPQPHAVHVGNPARRGARVSCAPLTWRFRAHLFIATGRAKCQSRCLVAHRDVETQRDNMADQIRASHILLMYAGSQRSSATRSKAEAQAQIAALAEQVAQGAEFSVIAKQYSDCPSKGRGGDLGSFPRGAMVPAFEDAAFALPVGGTSGVVETPFGYHLIRRTA